MAGHGTATTPAVEASDRQRLIVIGNGIAGARTVEEIIDRGGSERFAITMFGDEPHGNYNRISLSNVLAGSEDPAAIFLNPLDWYEHNAITLYAGVRVTKIDRYARTVTADDGSTHRYDKLIIATGSRPFFPPIDGLLDQGVPITGVFGFRTIADCDAMLQWARGARRLAVIGGGLLGLEAARGLLERGLEVDLATMDLREPERDDDELVTFSEPKRRVYKTVIVRDGKLVGATLLGDVGKVSFLMQAFDRGMVLPEERVSLLFDLGAPPPATSVAELADDVQSATATA